MGDHADMLRGYVDAFNRGDSAGYTACYAPDVVLVQGGGRELRGPEAISAFYAAFRQRADRVMTIKAIAEGESAVAAALHSRFVARVDGVELGGHLLNAGDGYEHSSMALYELSDGRFRRITATTIESHLVRAGDAA